jgi:hypothetical protein
MVWSLGQNTLIVQTREYDKPNLLGLNATAKGYLDNGITTTLQFRDGHNIIYHLTPAEMFAMTNAAGDHIINIFSTSWSLKDAIEAVDLTNGLPAALTEVNNVVWPV